MHCMEKCISEAYLMPANQVEKAIEVISYIGYYKKTGRPPIAAEQVLHALFFLPEQERSGELFLDVLVLQAPFMLHFKDWAILDSSTIFG